MLGEGLARLRQRFAVPEGFPPDVLAEAQGAADRTPVVGPGSAHADWTDREFVTLDPATSTDLDQAFVMEQAGLDLLLHYAMADVGWFVRPGGAMETEAWRRGLTLYLPDERARLYPPVLSEGAASLLPDGPRPAIVVTVRCTPAGDVALEDTRRAIIRSRAKLAYETVDMAAVPRLEDFAARMDRFEAARGAARVDPPEQIIERAGDGRFRLQLRPWLPSEKANSALSLAANIAIAQALHDAGIGLFREMPAPGERALARLRQTARGLGLDWPEDQPLRTFERSVDPATVAGSAFQFAVRRLTGGADYVPYRAGQNSFHAPIGAIYCHATAPMRRLADRYVLDAALALADRQQPPEPALFEKLADTMNAADDREGEIERSVLNLAEAALMHGREGEVFRALVTERDDKGVRFQLADLPVIARVDTNSVANGDELQVRLESADPLLGELRFTRVR